MFKKTRISFHSMARIQNQYRQHPRRIRYFFMDILEISNSNSSQFQRFKITRDSIYKYEDSHQILGQDKLLDYELLLLGFLLNLDVVNHFFFKLNFYTFKMRSSLSQRKDLTAPNGPNTIPQSKFPWLLEGKV